MTDETGPEEKSAEVAGPLAALKKAAEVGRAWERDFSTIGEGRYGKEGRELAEMCELAAADLEEMLERAGQVRERTKDVASPSALFRSGFSYGEAAVIWARLPESEQTTAPPPPDWESAWAIVRAQLATGGKI